jgi:hypothetical protein
VGQLGANAHGEVLEAGRVPDCYLGLLLDLAEDADAAGVLVVAPAALLHPVVPQPDGTVLYELLTGHPDRTPGQLCSWPTSPWSCGPGPPTPGPRLASTRRRPPAGWSPPGMVGTSRGFGWTG